MPGNSSSETAGVFVGREWVVLLRGMVAIAFGILAITWPDMTQAKLVSIFGLYALVHGTLSVVGAIGGRGQPGCLLLGTEGVIGLWAGILTLRTTLPTPFASVIVVWLWAIATGVLQIVEAIRLRRKMSGDVWLMLGGLVAVFFGAMVGLRPFIGVIGLAVAILVFALVFGLFEILLGQELREMRHGRAA
jgi:uncharacterized membrane protein HdeD (DUF308 family)